VGYYASWAARDGKTPLTLHGDKVTHIHYAFAKIGADLRIALGDPVYDIPNFSDLHELKKAYPHLKTLISVGGWTYSGLFSDAVLTQASREAFTDSIIDFIRAYGFDGVDINWEYPCGGGLPGNSARPEDKYNFTHFMAMLREKLDAAGQTDNKHYLLSFAGGAMTSYAANTELVKLAEYVDYAVVMTYDIHGIWGSFTDFNAPLYMPTEPSPQIKWSVDSGVKLWLNNGFPAEKILMGVPFYGYLYNGVPDASYGLYQSFSSGYSIPYDRIASNYLSNPIFVRHYHSTARVPWLFGANTFISYDDPESIALKAGYIADNGLGGAAIWELSQNADGILLEVLLNALS